MEYSTFPHFGEKYLLIFAYWGLPQVFIPNCKHCKNVHGGDRKSNYQNDSLKDTAKEVSKEYSCYFFVPWVLTTLKRHVSIYIGQ